jgi:hypothetical protein
MNVTAVGIAALGATGLVVLVRRGWIPRGPWAALAGVAALLLAIIVLGLLVAPVIE